MKKSGSRPQILSRIVKPEGVFPLFENTSCQGGETGIGGDMPGCTVKNRIDESFSPSGIFPLGENDVRYKRKGAENPLKNRLSVSKFSPKKE